MVFIFQIMKSAKRQKLEQILKSVKDITKEKNESKWASKLLSVEIECKNLRDMVDEHYFYFIVGAYHHSFVIHWISTEKTKELEFKVDCIFKDWEDYWIVEHGKGC